MPSDSISESLIFQIFLMPPDPLAIDLVLFNQIYINHFAMYMLSWNNRGNKPLKVPSDSILEGLIFQNFLGHAPDPLDLVLFNQIYTRHTHSVNASCSYVVHEDIICIHTNGSLEDVALL